MGTTFNVTTSCNVCDGDGLIDQWPGTATEGVNDPPSQIDCPFCENGIRTIGTVEIPQLDAIAIQVQALYDDLNP